MSKNRSAVWDVLAGGFVLLCAAAAAWSRSLPCILAMALAALFALPLPPVRRLWMRVLGIRMKKRPQRTEDSAGYAARLDRWRAHNRKQKRKWAVKYALIALLFGAGLWFCLPALRQLPFLTAPAATPEPASATAAPSPTPAPTEAPTPEPTPTPPPTPTPTPMLHTATLGFVGDIMVMPAQIADAKLPEGGYDFTESFLPMQRVFESVDVMCGNLEGTLAGEQAGYTKPLGEQQYTADGERIKRFQMFNAPDELAANLKAVGMDLLTLANNHSADKDDAGILRTVETVRAAGLRSIGTARSAEEFLEPCIVEANHIRFGFVGCTSVMNSGAPSLNEENRPFILTRLDSEEMMRAQMDACRAAGAEFLVVFAHWGREYMTKPDASQQKFTEDLIAWGADAIIGSHSHCPQPMSWVEAERDGRTVRVPVVCSLGNFIGNMNKENSNFGVFARLSIRKDDSGVTCTELACLPLLCTRSVGLRGSERIFQTVPCFLQGNAMEETHIPGAAVEKSMRDACRAVERIAIGKATDIPMLTALP